MLDGDRLGAGQEVGGLAAGHLVQLLDDHGVGRGQVLGGAPDEGADDLAVQVIQGDNGVCIHLGLILTDLLQGEQLGGDVVQTDIALHAVLTHGGDQIGGLAHGVPVQIGAIGLALGVGGIAGDGHALGCGAGGAVADHGGGAGGVVAVVVIELIFALHPDVAGHGPLLGVQQVDVRIAGGPAGLLHQIIVLIEIGLQRRLGVLLVLLHRPQAALAGVAIVQRGIAVIGVTTRRNSLVGGLLLQVVSERCHICRAHRETHGTGHGGGQQDGQDSSGFHGKCSFHFFLSRNRYNNRITVT